MELVYLWVEKYKNIEKQGFNFLPQFECKYSNKILTINSKEYEKNIFTDNINVTAIVGENGSGKSSVLNFIIEQNKSFGTFVFFSEKKLFIFSETIIEEKQLDIKGDIPFTLNPFYGRCYGTSLLFLKSYMDINTYSMSEQLTIPTRFFYFSEKIDFVSDLHKNTTELFNIVSINSKKNIDDNFETDPYSILALNQHFTYLKDKYLHKVLKYYPHLKKFINQYFKIEKVDYRVKDLGTIFLASPKFKENYKEDIFLTSMFNSFNKITNIESRLKIVCLIFCYLDKEDIKEFILKNDEMDYIQLYDLINEQKYKYIIIWNDFISIANKKENFQKIIESYFEFTKIVRREILEFSFLPQLSSGEEKLLYLLVNIYDSILDKKRIGMTGFTIILDEPDTLLHPNWQKKVVFLLVTLLNDFFKDNTFHIILTTHSPFFLSDLPKDNVLFLKKYMLDDIEVKNGNQKIRNCKNVTEEVTIKTFGANIHTLLSDSFFMEDGLMGEFAKRKINEIKRFYDVLTKYQNNIKIKKAYKWKYLKKRKRFWKIQEIIGEPFLQKIVKNQLEEIELILLGRDKAIDNEISRLQALKVSVK